MKKQVGDGLKDQIETQQLTELEKTIACSGCGEDIDPTKQEIHSQVINGITVRGRVYCQVCKPMGAMKETWQPQNNGRISKMFVVKS